MGGDVRLEPWTPAWGRRFAALAQQLQEALAGVLTGPVEHIGSTSVQGVLAKPVIDMMAPVADLAAASARASGLLADLGWEQRRHRSDAVLLVLPDGATSSPDDLPRAGVHLTVPGSELWRERLLFRDALRADAALRAEYVALKTGMLESGRYRSADKRELVRRVLAAAGHPLAEGLHEPPPQPGG